MSTQDELFKATHLSSIKGVAKQTLDKLEKLKLYNFYDLLLNLPYRYEDRTFIAKASDMLEYASSSYILLKIKKTPHIKQKITDICCEDHVGNECHIIFFHISKYLLKLLTVGAELLAFGSVKINNYASFNGRTVYNITQPDIQIIVDDEIELPSKLTPIYHLTKGISQNHMRNMINLALELLVKYPLAEFLPPDLNPYKLSLSAAILICHNPEPLEDHAKLYIEALPSFQRICYEELIAYKLTILELKSRQAKKDASSIIFNPKIHAQFLKTLPFSPTSAQERVFKEIMDDLAKTNAISRLVHGDVGSGKTLVAAMTMLQVAANDMQVAMLAPTELLAKQHHDKLSKLFKPLNIEVALVLSSLKKKERSLIQEAAKSGSIKIFVGTHALFQKDMQYEHLVLSIVDEQHRFGVEQREALLNKALTHESAHEVLMTATPIPRSMHALLNDDNAVSTIDVMPQGRSPIITAKVSQDRYLQVVERLRQHCSIDDENHTQIANNQAYWVCPLVEENEELEISSVKQRCADLQKHLPHLKIGMLNAQMNEKTKNEVMEDFILGKLHILVATTIVEVGVDVPNATVIVIENAERMGLAQLHQLRGRVGRGKKQSYCILLYNAVNKNNEPYTTGIQRLDILRNNTNGFDIANYDLQMRGPGEYFGTHQAGKENFRFADLNRDYDLLSSASKAAKEIFMQHPKAKEQLIKRWFPAVLALEKQREQELAEIKKTKD